jgi:Ca2+-binding RTX toxin-like protein
MAISINFSDANNDGRGIDFAAYLKTFDKKYEASDFGGFVNEDYDDGGTPGNMNDDVWKGDDYVTWDGKINGQSVIFEGGQDGWKYVFDGHVMGGDITAITFGTGTKESDDNPEYTNNGEIRIAFDEMEIPDYSDSWISDLSDSDVKNSTASLMKFLNSDSIEFTGSTGKDKFTGFNKADTLHGEAGADTLGGGKGNDTIYGDEGNDKLSGGKGIDTFVFENGDGKDTIRDFGNGADLIDFSGQFASFDEIIDAATDGSKGVTITYEGGSVTLTGWEIADLTEAHFVLTA